MVLNQHEARTVVADGDSLALRYEREMRTTAMDQSVRDSDRLRNVQASRDFWYGFAMVVTTALVAVTLIALYAVIV